MSALPHLTGPLCEVSYVLRYAGDPRDAALQHMVALEKALVKLGLTKVEHGLTGLQESEIGSYAWKLPLILDVAGERACILALDMISADLLVIDFWFSGGTTVSGPYSPGLLPSDEHHFTTFLILLYQEFGFAMGAVGYETDVLDLINGDEGWPSPQYLSSNLDARSALRARTNGTVAILCDHVLPGIEAFDEFEMIRSASLWRSS